MDGLLVDTEPLWFEAEAEVMERLGAPWTKADQEQLLGGSLANTVGHLLAKATRPAPPAGLSSGRVPASCSPRWPPPGSRTRW